MSDQRLPRPGLLGPACILALVSMLVFPGCKRSEPPPDLIKTQREAMEKSKEVGNTMQKGVDEHAKKADEDGK